MKTVVGTLNIFIFLVFRRASVSGRAGRRKKTKLGILDISKNLYCREKNHLRVLSRKYKTCQFTELF